MRSFLNLALALTIFMTQTLAYPRPQIVVRRQIDITSPVTNHNNNAIPAIVDLNTLNSTVPPPSSSYRIYPEVVASGQLPLSFTNTCVTNGSLNAYVTGLDANGRLVMLQTTGDWYYPTTSSSTPVPIVGDTAIPISTKNATTTITLPGWISSGRIWISEGPLHFFVVQSEASIWSLVTPSVVASSDPNANVNFGFVELTNDKTLGLFVNISFVDFIGLALGITVTSAVGAGSSTSTVSAVGQSSAASLTQTVPGLASTAASQICSNLKAQAAIDGQPWGNLCINDKNGKLLRILAPADYMSVNPEAFSEYWTSYIDQVWQTYSSQPLIIDSQSSAGNVSCTVSGNSLNCQGDNRSFPKPTAGDIFTCNTGTFSIFSTDNAVHRAVVPRLCAAINRSTLLLPGGNFTPSLLELQYYTVSPTNYYSKFVHQHEGTGVGYAFSYDDVAPDNGINESGLLLSTNPTNLQITVQGGP